MTATGADDTHAETALDVSSSWTRFPRMGYVSHFKPTAPADITTGTSYESYLSLTPSEYIAKLSQDYHINALQYYDWQYRHEQPVATGDLADKCPLWYRDTYASKKTITDYIKTRRTQTWVHSPTRWHTRLTTTTTQTLSRTSGVCVRTTDPTGFATSASRWWVPTPKGVNKPKSHQFMMNVNTQGWRDYITDQYVTQKDTSGSTAHTSTRSDRPSRRTHPATPWT